MARDLAKRFLPGVRTWDRHQVVDVLVALVFGVAGEVEALIDAHGQPFLLATACLTGPVLAGLLLVRRKRPLLTMSVFMAVAVAGSVLEALVVPAAERPSNQVVPIFAIMVMSYSLGAFGSRRDLLLGLPQPLVVVVIIDRPQPAGQSIPGAVAYFAVAVVGAAALGGRLIYGRQKLLKTLAGQRRQLDAQQAMQTRTALAAERLQLAGQLHEDLVAGMESLMTEAGAVEQQGAGRQPAAVAAIEIRARALLAETRKVVVSLAADCAPGAASPPATSGAEPPQAGGGAGQPAMTAPRMASSAAITWTALAAAVAGTWLLLQVRAAPDVRVPMPVALLGCLLIAAPLAMAWRWPLAMTAALWSAAALFSAFVTPLGNKFAAISLAFVPPFLVGYFAGRRAAAGLGICLLGGLVCFGWAGFARNYVFVIVLAAWIAGRILSARSRMVEEQRSNNQVLARQGEVRLRHAVAEERARIARDLHDSIGHHLTIIALQAGAARRLWTSDPRKARAALATAARVAAHGSAELKMGLGSGLALTGAASPGTVPVTDITALVDNARAAGLPVSLHAGETEPDLPGDVKLALFRVLQEALTNVLRHAPGAAADVTVQGDSSHVELVVTNSAGDHSSSWAAGGSHGQRGMRERIEEHGGHLDYGHQPDGGFEVRAWFPLPEAR